jgi:hypothetical protein
MQAGVAAREMAVVFPWWMATKVAFAGQDAALGEERNDVVLW